MTGGNLRKTVIGAGAGLAVMMVSCAMGETTWAMLGPTAGEGAAEAGVGLEGEAADAVFTATITNAVMAVLALIALTVFFRRRWNRLRKTPWRPLVFEPAVSLALVLGIIVLGMMGTLVAERVFGIQIRAEDGSLTDLGLDDRAKLYIGAYAFQSVVLLAFVMRLADRWEPAVDRRMPHVASGLLGVGAVVSVWPVLATVGFLGALVTWLLRGEAPDVIAHETLRAITDHEGGPWLMVTAALVVVAAPVVEEVAYRGLLQDALGRLRLGPWWSITATSVVFALMHAGNSAPHAMVTLFVLSLVFGWAYEKTGRLTAPIVMHMLFNLGNLTLALIAS